VMMPCHVQVSELKQRLKQLSQVQVICGFLENPCLYDPVWMNIMLPPGTYTVSLWNPNLIHLNTICQECR
jgi:hypothetical protein